MEKNKQVGDKRKFSFNENLYSIREIVDAPDVKLMWSWATGSCPHCKSRLTREIEHEFYRLEILATEGIEDADVTLEDIQIMGDTKDRRRMILPVEKYDEIFEKSKLFKKLKKEVI